MSLKINKHVLLWSIIIYLFVFQRALIGSISIFTYMDELFAIVVGIDLVAKALTKKVRLNADERTILWLLMLVSVIGVIGNTMSELLTQPMYIIVDGISTVKVWLAYYAIIITNWKIHIYDQLIQLMAKWGRLLVWIMLFFMVLSQVADIGMIASARYGIRAFKFVFNEPGNFSKMFYFLVPLLTADLCYRSSPYKKIVIVLALVVWASTMRSRAFSFIAVFLLLAVVFFTSNDNKCGEKIRKKINVAYIIPMCALVVAICWDQLVFYFTTDTQARSVLLRFGIMTMVEYFPLGAGFGTFGSDVAATQYSPLYERYGFNSIYGMRQGETYFLNDNYWPMVMGQFGFWGTMLMLTVLIKFMRMAINSTKENKYMYFSTFCALGFTLLSSVASKSYCEFSSICVFILISIFVRRSKIVDAKG